MSGKSSKPGHTCNNKSGVKFVGPCVALSFLVAVGPAYANHADRVGFGFDRAAIRQMRVEQRLARIEARQQDNTPREKHLALLLLRLVWPEPSMFITQTCRPPVRFE